MERDGCSGDGGNEGGSRTGDGGNERGSWSEEIDLLRRDNERDSWSGVGGPFQRDSHTLDSDDHAGVGHFLMGDSFPGDGDHIVSPLVRGSQTIYSNGDLRGYEGDRTIEENPYFSGEDPISKDYYLDFERDRLLRVVNERDWQPTKAYERLSVDRAHTMKDFEKQITELKKENFNLKLRIYFLEEQVQRHCDNSSEDLHRMNIELKVEVESLKHEFQEKQNLLVRASKAMESMAGEHTFALQQLKEEHMKLLRDLEESHFQKVQLLAEEVKQEKAELEKVCMLLDQERMQRFNAEERLVAVKEQYSKSMGILEERDWIIQCLNETLRSKDALIAQLEKQINTMMPNDSPTGESPSQTAGGLFTEHEIKEGSGVTCKECLSTRSSEERQENINEWQKKIKEMESLVSELQQKLEGNKAGFAMEEKNALKRDKAIQGLTLALKKKTKENEKLLKDIDNLNAALAKAKETVQCDQSQNLREENSHPDYKKLLITIQAQQDLCSRLHEYERESGSLQKELDAILMLRQWLEKDIQANQELRKMLEAQIMAKYRDSDTFSYLGDQTSYMSICLGQNNDHFDGNVEAVSRPPMRSAETQTMPEESLSNLQSLFTKSQQEDKLGLSVADKDTTKEETATAIAMDCKKGPTVQNHNAVSSSTQTELKYYADKGILVDICQFGREASSALGEGETVVADSENFQMSSEFDKRSFELQKDKQQKCFSNNLTKSKIPILLKSSLSTRPKMEPDLTPCGNAHICLEKELHEENCRLYEQLRSAEMEIEALKSNQEKPGEFSHGLDNPFVAETNSSGQTLLNAQWAEEAGLSMELKCRHANGVNPPPAGDLSIQKVSLPNLDTSDKLERGFLQQEMHKQLQLENDRLLEKLNRAQMEIERLQLHEVDREHTDAKAVLNNSDTVEQGLFGHSLQGEMQLENLKLTEQLKCAQMDIQRLKMTKDVLENVSSASDLERVNTAEKGLSEQSLIKELQLENHQLAEQLKCAQEEIEKLREEKVLLEDLDNMDARDREDSEHSFLDKTITNSASEIHNGNSDLEVQVDNFTSQNIVGLHCHHNYCVECANNQETLILQTSSLKKVSTVESECKLLKISSANKSFEDTSLSKYDLLVQSQARELSHHRQQIKESHNLSVVCSKNFINIIKAFEDLIPCTGLDSNIALGFREQLNQTVEWLKELEYKLSDAYYGEEDANSDHSTDSLLNTPSRLVPGHRMWADKHGCHVLGLVEDYSALQKQISEAKTVLQETEAFIDHGVQTAVLNMTEHFGNVFFEKLNRTKQSLEEANCLLKLLWRVSLPLQTRSSYNVGQAEETNLEVIQLRKRVVEQEKLLSGMVKRVYSETQMKEDIEKVILDQLAMTHEILKRAKGNLQVQVVDQRA
ncbi:CDK5 regulatory subunit-associated protein 2-like [Hyperolius riggenbachi]|uniref:CDK5 regulatory subunit-associated protein 2-like n=1 Tax=Hyperolius riggenbachi TaxID=752182 RepID=UPI0035A335AE